MAKTAATATPAAATEGAASPQTFTVPPDLSGVRLGRVQLVPGHTYRLRSEDDGPGMAIDETSRLATPDGMKQMQDALDAKRALFAKMKDARAARVTT